MLMVAVQDAHAFAASKPASARPWQPMAVAPSAQHTAGDATAQTASATGNANAAHPHTAISEAANEQHLTSSTATRLQAEPVHTPAALSDSFADVPNSACLQPAHVHIDREPEPDTVHPSSHSTLLAKQAQHAKQELVSAGSVPDRQTIAVRSGANAAQHNTAADSCISADTGTAQEHIHIAQASNDNTLRTCQQHNQRHALDTQPAPGKRADGAAAESTMPGARAATPPASDAVHKIQEGMVEVHEALQLAMQSLRSGSTLSSEQWLDFLADLDGHVHSITAA